MNESHYAMVCQDKILAKYGTLHGISSGMLDRIASGTATQQELLTYTQNADKLVETFKSDMRNTEPENYTSADIDIIVSMVATNYAAFDKRDESYSKVITENGVTRMMEGGAPSMAGFSALDRHSEHLSPQQTISQFGLNYEYTTGSGDKVTPYLVNDGGTLKAQPFIYCMTSPMSDEIRKNARVPMDPRVLQKVEAIANDPNRSEDDPIKQMAKNISRPDVCCVIPRNNGGDTTALMAGYEARGFKIEKGLEAPYTGNTMPQYGNVGDMRGAYVDLVQEMSLGKGPTVCPVGTTIYLKVPNPNAPTDPSLPAGSLSVKVAVWNGQSWDKFATDEEIAAAHAVALGTLSPEAQAKVAPRLVSPQKIKEASDKSKTKASLAVPLPEPVKQAIVKEERDTQRSLAAPTLEIHAAKPKKKMNTKMAKRRDAKTKTAKTASPAK